MAGKIIRGLFNEREKIAEGEIDEFFNNDNLAKILRLMQAYSINSEVGFIGRVQSIPIFLERLSYHFSEGKIKDFYDLSQIYNLFINSNLNEFSSIVELFVITLGELETQHFRGANITNKFMEEFNNLLAIKTIPFRLDVIKDKIFLDRINSPREEEMKKEIYELINSTNFNEVNIHFTNALINFAKRDYPESIKESYLALEKYLNVCIGNHKLDALKSYEEFEKKFDVERGAFKIYHKKIKEKIGLVYNLRSDISDHSDKEIFDRKDFLEETARFQLNEVMNLIILLDSFKKK